MGQTRKSKGYRAALEMVKIIKDLEAMEVDKLIEYSGLSRPIAGAIRQGIIAAYLHFDNENLKCEVKTRIIKEIIKDQEKEIEELKSQLAEVTL